MIFTISLSDGASGRRFEAVISNRTHFFFFLSPSCGIFKRNLPGFTIAGARGALRKRARARGRGESRRERVIFREIRYRRSRSER